MLNKERFFRFGLDLQLEGIDPPEDMSMWGGKPGFAEENLATVLSFNLPTLLPDEEWLVIGRDDTNMAEPDLTVVTKAGDLVLFEIKRGLGTPKMVDQNTRYLINALGRRYPYYLSRYLRMQCDREWVEPVRLLALLKGKRLDKSGPVGRLNLQRLKDNNDTDLTNEKLLSLGRDVLREHGCLPLSEVPSHQAALIEAFSRRFGFGDHELLQTSLGKSINLALVAKDFSDDFLKKAEVLREFGVFFYLLKAELYRHESDPGSFLLKFAPEVPDGEDSEPHLFEARRFLGFLKEELFELDASGVHSGRGQLRVPLHNWAWCYAAYDRRCLRFHPMEVGHHGRVDLKEQQVLWVVEWTDMGTRPRIVSEIREKLRAPETQLPRGMSHRGKKGSLTKSLEIPAQLTRATARDLAGDVYDFLKWSFNFYDSCGLWDDPYDDYARLT